MEDKHLTYADAYLETRVMSAPPHQLHLMVVDAALRFARLGEKCLQEEDFSGAYAALNRSRECVKELIVGLRPNQAPELIAQINELFMFVYRRLVDADLKRSAQLARDAIRILEIHRNTWAELIQALPKELAGPHTPPVRDEMSESRMSWTT
jgi:flagellar protein FliS